MRRTPASGFSLVEVIVALAVLGLALAAFAALQVTNLRASRSALEVRTATALLAFEAGARSLLDDPSADCRVAAWLPSGWSCAVASGCGEGTGCAVRDLAIEVAVPGGRLYSTAVKAHAELEAAPYRPAAPPDPLASEGGAGR